MMRTGWGRRGNSGMRTILAALGLAWCCAAHSSIAGENWPQFRGPTADGQCGDVSLPVTWNEEGDKRSPNLRWKTPLPGRGWSSPVIWGEQIWLTTATPNGKELSALCVDRDSGKLLHNFKLFDVEKPEEIHALNSYASCTPVIEAGRVYLHFGSYGTACVDTATAKVLWSRRDLPCNHFRGPGSSPMLHGDLVIIHYDGFDFQYVVALHKKTGDTVWKTDRSVDWGKTDGDFKKAYSTPLLINVNGRQELVSSGSKAVMAYDPQTGKELWKVRYEGFSSTARPLYGHGLVFVNTGFSKADLFAIKPGGSGDVTDTHVAWTITKGIGSKPSPVLVGELIFQCHDGGVATCIDAKSGREVWAKRLKGQYSASLLAAGDRVYCFNQQGESTVLRADRTGDILATNKLPAGCMSTPAATGKALILRTEQALYRIED